MITFDIRLFGAMEIRHHGALLTDFRSQKALALLAYLICIDRPVTREYLAGLGWPEVEQSQALGLLRRTLHDLNSKLPGCLVVDRRTVYFQPETPVAVDVRTFAGLAAQTDPVAWVQAVDLYRAPFLEGLYLDEAPDLESWLLREQEQWQQRVASLLARLTDRHTAAAAYAKALHYVRRLVALEPWREEAHRQVMLLLARTGQISAALAQYETCRRHLREELDVEPARETENLRTRIAALAHRPDQPLPPATTPFVGRVEELAELTQLLANPHCRIITLVGAGGMGKTRLALETARTVVADQQRIFLHGASFVPLVGVNTLAQVVAALAQALAVSLQAQGSPESQLLRYLRDKELLLVLDNFEQLATEPILTFVRQLLDTAPDLKLLITSRARLSLQGEQLYWLQGLPVPVTTTRAAHLSVAELASYSSVQLFLATVQRLRPHYRLSTDDAPAVMAICQQVQGMPLAIELAAAWMSILAPAEIAAELTRTLDFLAGDLHDLPLRQRSMRAVFAASWRLLTEGEQRIFQQLSVFHGSFTREAAEAVTGASLPVLMSLIHKSFLQRKPDGRYQIHELLRQFGEGHLAQSPVEEATTQDRHSAYYLTFLAQRTPGLMGPEQPTLLKEIGQEIDNIRTGWLWAARQGRIDQLDATLDGLHQYYEVRSQYEEGIELFMLSIQSEQPAGPPALSQHIINRMQARQGALNCEFGHYEQARTLLDACLAAARGLDDKTESAFCLDYMGRTVWWQESGVAALPLLEESLLIRRTLGDQIGVATTLDVLAAVCDMSCEFAQACQFAEQGLAVSRMIGHTYRIASLLRRLGSAAVGLGEYTVAVSYYQEALATFRQLNDHYGIVQALAEMGRAMYGAGNYPRDTFIGALEEAAMIARKHGNYLYLFYGVGIFADVSNWIGEYEIGLRCGQELLELSWHMPPTFLASSLRLVGEAQVGLGNLHLARQHLLEALAVMLKSETRLLINCQVAMLAWANLLCRECMQPDVASQPNHIQQRQARALEIVSSLLHEEKSRPMYKTRAAALTAKLEAFLPPAPAAAAKATGKAKTTVQIATEIVKEEHQAARSSLQV